MASSRRGSPKGRGTLAEDVAARAAERSSWCRSARARPLRAPLSQSDPDIPRRFHRACSTPATPTRASGPPRANRAPPGLAYTLTFGALAHPQRFTNAPRAARKPLEAAATMVATDLPFAFSWDEPAPRLPARLLVASISERASRGAPLKLALPAFVAHAAAGAKRARARHLHAGGEPHLHLARAGAELRRALASSAAASTPGAIRVEQLRAINGDTSAH